MRTWCPVLGQASCNRRDGRTDLSLLVKDKEGLQSSSRAQDPSRRSTVDSSQRSPRSWQPFRKPPVSDVTRIHRLGRDSASGLLLFPSPLPPDLRPRLVCSRDQSKFTDREQDVAAENISPRIMRFLDPIKPGCSSWAPTTCDPPRSPLSHGRSSRFDACYLRSRLG